MLVVVEDGGGLANRLFVFANVIGTGLATSHRVINPSFRHWADSFEGTAGDAMSTFPRRRRALFGGNLAARIAASLSYRSCRILAGSRRGPLRAISLNWPQHCDLDSPRELTDLRCRRLVLFKGWLFRNPSAVQRHAALIRDFFQPVSDIRDEAERAVTEARSGCDVLVGVHVRHRDYRQFMEGRYFYPFPTYVDLMRSLAARLAPRRAAFLVCSDEAQDRSAANDLLVTLSTMDPVQDLWALSRCDLVMGPPSTFSAWAAFLGKVPLWELDGPHCEPNPSDFAVPLPVPRPPLESSSATREENTGQGS
jgi:hypothetical protein